MGNIALEQAYYLAQISAGIAVVISLIYVGIQLKQNTRAIRLTTMILGLADRPLIILRILDLKNATILLERLL